VQGGFERLNQEGTLMSSVEVSVVVPVFRSEASLRALVARLLRTLEETGLRHEVVLVEDGGGDGSWSLLRELQAAEADRIVIIQLMRNYGQHNALMCGFRHARGEYIITLDDDLQNPPEEIPKLLDQIRTGEFDLVYGIYSSKRHSPWRNLGSAVVNAFYRLAFQNSVTITSFRAITRPLLMSILSYDWNFTFVDGLLAWNTQRIGQVEVEHHPRAAGLSGYNVAKLVLLSVNLFTNFTLLPLRIVSWFGLALSAVGFSLVLYYLFQSLRSQISVPGYASTIIAILVVGGTQLLAMGVIGEYLGRLHLNVNRKPQYTVRSFRAGHSRALVPNGSSIDDVPIALEPAGRTTRADSAQGPAVKGIHTAAVQGRQSSRAGDSTSEQRG
jgi:polyisoprenyl-phosphate glycosyltransferase